jgi:hypothetical protein
LVSGLLVGVIVLLGAGYIVLGSRVKTGNRGAAITSVILAWPVWLTILVYFLTTWKCFYEFVLSSSILIGAHVALSEVSRDRGSTTDEA